MGECIYSDFEGVCGLWDENDPTGTDLDEENGVCCWENDPNPEDSCPINGYENDKEDI